MAVLSGNDGCVIARSNEVKALGIKMGAPLFQVREIVKNNNVKLFSANHALYADISQRVMATLRGSVPALEIYSVDEAFLDFSTFRVDELKSYGEWLSTKVRKEVGIPVSIGIAPSKTLAKIASHLCKKYPRLKGCCVMHRTEDIEKVLKNYPIEDVWGIGRRSAQKLHSAGVRTAYDFTKLPKSWIKMEMHLPGVRIWEELQAQSVIPLSVIPAANQSVSIARTFSTEKTTIEELQSIISRFSSIIARKLRLQKSCASMLEVYVQTNRHRAGIEQYTGRHTTKFATPTNSTMELSSAALSSLQQIFKQGSRYKKAGIVCQDLRPQNTVQSSIFEAQQRDKENRLMEAMDAINSAYGTDSVQLGAYATNNKEVIFSNKEHLSPNFTTSWEGLPLVRV